MTLAVSHLAWSPEEEEAGWSLAAERGLLAGEVAPGRCWSQEALLAWGRGEVKELPFLRRPFEGTGGTDGTNWRWVGFQALFFGFPDWQLFSSDTSEAMARHVAGLARLCGREGGRYLVFGAPKNRWIPEGMTGGEVFERAAVFFQALAKEVWASGVFVALEANPAAYGGNFGLQSREVQAVVRAVNHPGLRWHLDTGELAMNGVCGAEVDAVIREGADVLGSVHVSEPFLGDFSEPWQGHAAVAAALRALRYEGTISLEMKRPVAGLAAVNRAIDFLLCHYGESAKEPETGMKS